MKKKKRLYKPIFTTRKDFSFIMFLSLLSLLFLYFMTIFLDASKYLEAVISLLFVVIFSSFLFNNKIILEKFYLRVNFGIFTYRIKYKDIKELYVSDNHLSSFTSSYHKVGIKTSRYKSKLFDTFVSPMDREDFIYEVNKRR